MPTDESSTAARKGERSNGSARVGPLAAERIARGRTVAGDGRLGHRGIEQVKKRRGARWASTAAGAGWTGSDEGADLGVGQFAFLRQHGRRRRPRLERPQPTISPDRPLAALSPDVGRSSRTRARQSLRMASSRPGSFQPLPVPDLPPPGSSSSSYRPSLFAPPQDDGRQRTFRLVRRPLGGAA